MEGEEFILWLGRFSSLRGWLSRGRGSRRRYSWSGSGCSRRLRQNIVPVSTHSTTVKDCQNERKQHKQTRKNSRGACQQISRTTPGHERSHTLTAANSQATTFTALNKHSANQGNGNAKMQNQQGSGHGVFQVKC
jgi:hypothetical protein